MAWRIEFTPAAEKALTELGIDTQKRIVGFMRERAANRDDPRRFGKGLSSSLAGLWHYRIGDYRVIVDIQDDKIVVLVLSVGHRSNVYGGH